MTLAQRAHHKASALLWPPPLSAGTAANLACRNPPLSCRTASSWASACCAASCCTCCADARSASAAASAAARASCCSCSICCRLSRCTSASLQVRSASLTAVCCSTPAQPARSTDKQRLRVSVQCHTVCSSARAYGKQDAAHACRQTRQQGKKYTCSQAGPGPDLQGISTKATTPASPVQGP